MSAINCKNYLFIFERAIFCRLLSIGKRIFPEAE